MDLNTTCKIIEDKEFLFEILFQPNRTQNKGFLDTKDEEVNQNITPVVD
jgi:hypothetical protein